MLLISKHYFLVPCRTEYWLISILAVLNYVLTVICIVIIIITINVWTIWYWIQNKTIDYIYYLLRFTCCLYALNIMTIPAGKTLILLSRDYLFLSPAIEPIQKSLSYSNEHNANQKVLELINKWLIGWKFTND